MRRVIFTQKGGVGKSSISCNLAAISAKQGLKTLLIDLDPQGNASHYLSGRQASEFDQGVGNLFNQALAYSFETKYPLTDFVHPTPFANLFVMPASNELDLLTAKLEQRQKIYKFRDALEELEETFDAIYVDTQPALNFFTRAALIGTHRCLIPFDCDQFSRNALYQMMATIEELREDHNPHLEVEGIVANQFQPRASLPQKLVQELKDEGLPLLPVYLSSSVKMRESHEVHRPLIDLAPKHKLTQEFIALYRYLHGLGSEHEPAATDLPTDTESAHKANLVAES